MSRTQTVDLPGSMDRRIKIAKPGAIMGAISHSRTRTTTDAHGAQTAVLGVKADPRDQSGRLVETYGICECRCGAPGWRTTRLGGGDPM